MRQKFLFMLMFFAIATSASSQGLHNVIFFSEGGEAFTLFINGVQQNNEPATNVKVSDLRGTGYQLRVVFEMAVPGEFSKNMPLPEGSTEMTFAFKKNNKGAWAARFVSEAPYLQKPDQQITTRTESLPASAQPTENRVQPGDKEQQPGVVIIATETAQSSTSKNKPPNNQTQEVITTTTTVSEDLTGNPAGTIGISISAGESNLNMDVKVDETSAMQTTTTVTTITTQQVNPDVDYQAAPPAEITAQSQQNDNCPEPMRNSDFSKAKGSISSKSFEDSKLSIAKQITRGNCLSSNQVKEIMELFSFEETRLDFAKFAYDYTYDKGNYFQVNDAFQFEMTIEELDEYLNKR